MKLLLAILLVRLACARRDHFDFTYGEWNAKPEVRVCVPKGMEDVCPRLRMADRSLKCVLVKNRLDCVQRMGNGTADMGLFSAQDLFAAQWTGADMLVTHELRSNSDPFEYSLVAVVSRLWGWRSELFPNYRNMLSGSRLCHPGVGSTDETSAALIDYMESLVAGQSCDSTLSPTENKLKSLSGYYSSACRAGPWSSILFLDKLLKNKYRNLCEGCHGPDDCSTADKHWGWQGALACLAERSGDVAWARQADVRKAFGVGDKSPSALSSEFMYLCRSGNVRPMSDLQPCVWLEKPWPVIAVRSNVSGSIRPMTEVAWSVLSSFLGLEHLKPSALQHPTGPAHFLARARGFADAHNKGNCRNSGTITLCNWSDEDLEECNLLVRAATTQGLDTPLRCTLRNDCIISVINDEDDSVIAGQNFQIHAETKYNFKPVLLEATPILNDMYTVTAYVRKDSNITSFADMRSRRAAFPVHDGVAWHAVIKHLIREELISEESCPYESSLAAFFGDSCAPRWEERAGVTEEIKAKLTKQCRGYGHGEGVALRALVEGLVDVAFFSNSTMKYYADGARDDTWAAKLKSADYKQVCPSGDDSCHISWTSVGQIYIKQTTSGARQLEIENAYKQLDNLFGVRRLFHRTALTTFAPLITEDRQPDTPFHDPMKSLMTHEEFGNFSKGFRDHFDPSLPSHLHGAECLLL